jgi:hypothetical protein
MGLAQIVCAGIRESFEEEGAYVCFPGRIHNGFMSQDCIRFGWIGPSEQENWDADLDDAQSIHESTLVKGTVNKSHIRCESPWAE